MRKVREPRECSLCGQMFLPRHGSKTICPECDDIIKRHKRPTYEYDSPKDFTQYEYLLRKRNIENHKDTIVAEGYADRQRARTLARVEPIKTTL